MIGTITLFLGASIALTQQDLKKGLAYSTVSQLGYMMLAMGCGAPVAGMFHLVTHAFFKAMLFLGSGSVIHAMEEVVGHEPVLAQDMRLMGGLRKYMPVTAITFLLPVPRGVTVTMGLVSILVGPWLIPSGTPPAGGVQVPASEFVCRMVAALTMAASVLLLAADTPPLVSAMLLTYPINGSVLPAFTRALYGGPAARSVLTGFCIGLRGVGLFMVATAWCLETLDNRWVGYALGVSGAIAYAVWLWIPKRSS